jgi:hypothetical protein
MTTIQKVDHIMNELTKHLIRLAELPVVKTGRKEDNRMVIQMVHHG